MNVKHVRRELIDWYVAMHELRFNVHLPMNFLVETVRALAYTLTHLTVYGLAIALVVDLLS